MSLDLDWTTISWFYSVHVLCTHKLVQDLICTWILVQRNGILAYIFGCGGKKDRSGNFTRFGPVVIK